MTTTSYYVGDVPEWPTHPGVLAEVLDSRVGRPTTIGAAAMMSNYLTCPACRRPVRIDWGSDQWAWTHGAYPMPLKCGHNLRSPFVGRVFGSTTSEGAR